MRVRYVVQIHIVGKRKTSVHVEVTKVLAAKGILGARTLADTVDVALSEVVGREQRRELLELLWTPGALELDEPSVMAGAWR